MKKGILLSYIEGITDVSRGESYKNILKYFFPEFITAMILYVGLSILDAYWIGHLKSTSTYATFGITSTLIHFIIKVAEGLSVGSIILSGQHNGAGNNKKVGQTLADTFWLTCILGFSISAALYFGAYWIFYLYGVPDKMIYLGIPFLKLRSIGIFFTFVYFAFIAFLRGIKDTKTPMQIFIAGAIVFICCDYVLIFGKFGFPQMKLNGSALATVIQYAVMLCLAIYAVLFKKENQKYGISLFTHISDYSNIKKLILLSWPVVLDKATMAISYIWLAKMIAPMGKYAIASFAVIKDMEKIAFLPAIAFAQVITLLVSNDFGASNFTGIKSNIKKVIFLTSIFVFVILLTFSLNPKFFIRLFDHKDAFTDFSAKVFPILSFLVFFDLIQIILSGALRGIGDVRVVMWTRLFVCLGCFCPISYFISNMAFENQLMKFILIYAMFYLSTSLMSLIYIARFRSYSWNKIKEEPTYIPTMRAPEDFVIDGVHAKNQKNKETGNFN